MKILVKFGVYLYAFFLTVALVVSISLLLEVIGVIDMEYLFGMATKLETWLGIAFGTIAIGTSEDYILERDGVYD